MAGYLISEQRETWLRDKYAQVCTRCRIPIVHLILAPDPQRCSVRANGCTIDSLLCEAGKAIARAITAEHGGHIQTLTDQWIGVTHLSRVGAERLISRVALGEFWFAAEWTLGGVR